MKQTNNAIKFLMAQYRAIFKNANIAMVAAIAAAALASGQAQAAAPTPVDIDNAKFETLSGPVTVDGKGQTQEGDPLTYKDLKLTGVESSSTEGPAVEMTITGGQGHTIKGVAAAKKPSATPAKPHINLSQTSITIAKDTTDVKLTIGESGSTGGSSNVDAAATNVTLKNLGYCY